MNPSRIARTFPFLKLASLAIALALAACGTSASAADTGPVYLVFANTSTHPYHVQAITLDGAACPACTDRTITPGTITMVKIGELGSKQLKLEITGSGNGTCTYSVSARVSSENGDCGSSPKTAFITNVHSELMFDTKGTPRFDMFYAYDPPGGK